MVASSIQGGPPRDKRRSSQKVKGNNERMPAAKAIFRTVSTVLASEK